MTWYSCHIWWLQITQTSHTTMGLCIRGKIDGCHDGLMFRVETSSPKASNPYEDLNLLWWWGVQLGNNKRARRFWSGGMNEDSS